MKKQEEKKEVSFIDVINVIAGIIYVLFGLFSLVLAVYYSPIIYVSVFLFLSSAVFLFLPQRIFKMNKWLKLLIATAGFFIAIILAGANVPILKPEFVDYNLKEEFVIKYNKLNFTMIIYNTTKEDRLIVDDKERTTNGIFLVVNGGVKNLGSHASDLSFSSGLIDDKNNTYSSFAGSIGEGLIQPNLERNFMNVFEIPKDARGLKFLVQDDTKLIKRIDLGR